ncbi:MAG: hypothetical protein ABW184_17900 [Sphingobium sp.]
MPIRPILSAALAALALPALALPTAAQAGLLDGLGTCTLTLSGSGTMTMGGDGRTLSSQNSGGGAAGMLLVGVNITPELVFSAPTLIGPPGWSATPTTMIAIDTLSGTHTGFRNGPVVVRPGVLLDTLSIHARVTSPEGFRAGSYQARTTVTCQSAS